MTDKIEEAVAVAIAAIQFKLPGAGGLRGTLNLAPAQAREFASAAILAHTQALKAEGYVIVHPATTGTQRCGPQMKRSTSEFWLIVAAVNWGISGMVLLVRYSDIPAPSWWGWPLFWVSVAALILSEVTRKPSK